MIASTCGAESLSEEASQGYTEEFLAVPKLLFLCDLVQVSLGCHDATVCAAL